MSNSLQHDFQTVLLFTTPAELDKNCPDWLNEVEMKGIEMNHAQLSSNFMKIVVCRFVHYYVHLFWDVR